MDFMYYVYILFRNQDSEALSMSSIEISYLLGQMSAPLDSEYSQNTPNSTEKQTSTAAQAQQLSSELSPLDVTTQKKPPERVPKSPAKAVTPRMLLHIFEGFWVILIKHIVKSKKCISCILEKLKLHIKEKWIFELTGDYVFLKVPLPVHGLCLCL